MFKQSFSTLKKNEEGSFTIEASLIFPILMMLVICFIFFSLVIYEKATLHYKANSIASDLAYTWNNSSMDVETGAFGVEELSTQANGDGLYWRLTGNNVLSKFGLEGSADNSLVTKKIDRINDYNGEISFNNGFLIREIEVSLKKSLALPSYISKLFGGNGISAVAKQPITEPTELIRNTDFVIYGSGKIADYGSYIFDFMGKGK